MTESTRNEIPLSDTDGVATLAAEQAAALDQEGEREETQVRRPPLWRRFMRHRLALASLVVIVIFVLVGVFARSLHELQNWSSCAESPVFDGSPKTPLICVSRSLFVW